MKVHFTSDVQAKLEQMAREMLDRRPGHAHWSRTLWPKRGGRKLAPLAHTHSSGLHDAF
jgi:hypothetical protein